MIKCFADSKTEHCDVELEGNGEELFVEFLAIARNLYRGIAEEQPEAAKAFQYLVKKAMTEPDSPVWAEK